MRKITEEDSHYQDIEEMSVKDILLSINKEDEKIALAVKANLKDIEEFVEELIHRVNRGGRLFYIGAGTSGRLGILDASECPPTFGVSHDVVVGLIAGGDSAIRKAVEFAEDDVNGAWKDLTMYKPTSNDTIVGLAASGTTPYVVGGLKKAKEEGLLTACITCNPGSPVTHDIHHPIVIEVGPEFITGSTRMKSGTAQKMVLNMISTALMVKIGRVKGNKMIDMQLANNKLLDRGTRMIIQETGWEYNKAFEWLIKHQNVRKALTAISKCQ